MSATAEELELKAAIREELTHPSCAKLPNLCKQIADRQGMAAAEEYIYTQCATYGIAVQTAMSDYDSSLGE